MFQIIHNILLQAPSPDHFLFRDGKINTVFVVVLIIWGGTLGYLLLSGKKVSRLEKKANEIQESLKQKQNQNKQS